MYIAHDAQKQRRRRAIYGLRKRNGWSTNFKEQKGWSGKPKTYRKLALQVVKGKKTKTLKANTDLKKNLEQDIGLSR